MPRLSYSSRSSLGSRPCTSHCGNPAQQAAVQLAWVSLAGLPASLIVLVAAGLVRRQHKLAILAVTGMLIGLAGVIFAPLELSTLFAGVLGLSLGASFGLGIALIVLKAEGDVTAFSAVTQGFGYVFAAIGPLAIGLLRGAGMPWAGAFGMLAVIVVVQLVTGCAAGRHIVERPRSGKPVSDAASAAQAIPGTSDQPDDSVARPGGKG